MLTACAHPYARPRRSQEQRAQLRDLLVNCERKLVPSADSYVYADYSDAADQYLSSLLTIFTSASEGRPRLSRAQARTLMITA